MFMSSLRARTVRLAGGVSFVLAAAASAAAQPAADQPRMWEFRVPSGALAQTGMREADLQRAPLTAIQVSRLIAPRVALTGMVGWARSRDLARPATPKVDVLASDVGIEARSTERGRQGALSVQPFVGAGVGLRSYHYRKAAADTMHGVAAYAAAGGEVGVRRVSVRLEARYYLSGAANGRSGLRNDVMIMAGIGLNRPAQEKRQ